jgi:sugar O-acyltransferase (sialic acid O-acetyltransferase NeuD family)
VAESKQIVGIGAGGHSRVIIDIFRLAGVFEVVGLVDPDQELWGTSVDGIRVVGNDLQLPELYSRGTIRAFNGVGSSGSSEARRRIFEFASGIGFEFPQAIHPSAVIAASSDLGNGVAVMANAAVNPGTLIGSNVIINTGAIVEHDCIVGDHAHVSVGSRLGGRVRVGEGSHIGIGASVREGISIGRNSIVGAGAAVVDDVPDNVVVAGVPAKVLRTVVA